MSDKKDNKKKKIGKALSYVGDTLKGIATANAGHQNTNYSPEREPAQRPVDIDPFGTDNDAPA
tara:strand:+ start:3046 stop:3234 length:189 start_codon:yes stop_codon:yes gene_type:complete